MTKRLVLFLAGSGFLIALSFLLDAPVHNLLFAYRPDWLVAVAKCISKFGGWIGLMMGCGLFLLVAIRRRDEKWRRLLITMMITASLAGLAADGIRAATGRARPNSGVAPGWYGIRNGSRWLIIDSRYNSFPSGHTAAAMGLAAPLLLLRRRSGWLLLTLAVVIAASRLILDAHHFSDVIAGALLAFAVSAWWLKKGA